MKALSRRVVAGIASSLLIVPALPAVAAKEKVLHSFGGGADGANPQAALIDADGTLYGTTAYGGSTGCGGSGCGTLFTMTQSGGETMLHAFDQTGAEPRSAVAKIGQTLYGTTSFGGGVYTYDLETGTETVLGSSGRGSGATPVKVGGSLYATSIDGGTDGYGSVYAISLGSGAGSVIHSFGTGHDGVFPKAGLVAVGKTLYGTTYYGGTGGDGTIYTVDISGDGERVARSLDSASGENPVSAPIQTGAYLYGTALEGGAYSSGTVYRLAIAQPQRIKVLHAFGGSDLDGVSPAGALLDVNGMLYGTTESGGKFGYGTVFSVDAKTGAETVLYSFIGGAYNDGADPEAGLVYIKGVLYGTTYSGGVYGLGTVFSVRP